MQRAAEAIDQKNKLITGFKTELERGLALLDEQTKVIDRLRSALQRECDISRATSKSLDDKMAELAIARNQLSTERPTSFGNYKWACGHEGPSVCEQCWSEKLTELVAARRETESARAAHRSGLKIIESERERVAAYERAIRFLRGYDDGFVQRTLAAIPEPQSMCLDASMPHDFINRGDGTARCKDCGAQVDVTETGAAR